MNEHIKSYHEALRSRFTGLASSLAADFLQTYREQIDEAYARQLREGTAYNSPPFIYHCKPSAAPDL